MKVLNLSTTPAFQPPALHPALHHLDATDHCRDCRVHVDELHARGDSISGYDPEGNRS